MSKVLIELKIKGRTYKITEFDLFIDKHSCIQILTQKGKFNKECYRYETPTLTNKAIKEILKFDWLTREHKYGTDCTVFSLKKKEAVK